MPVPAAWRDTSLALRDSSYANLPWWQVLGDTTLQRLIRTALKENRDVHIALARVNEARAMLGIQRLEQLPQIDIVGGLRHPEGADSLLTGLTPHDSDTRSEPQLGARPLGRGSAGSASPPRPRSSRASRAAGASS